MVEEGVDTFVKPGRHRIGRMHLAVGVLRQTRRAAVDGGGAAREAGAAGQLAVVAEGEGRLQRRHQCETQAEQAGAGCRNTRTMHVIPLTYRTYSAMRSGYGGADYETHTDAPAT
jgi:hypothetical protein